MVNKTTTGTIDIKSMSLEEVQNFIIKNKYPKFRGEQVYNWLLKGVKEFKEMKNIPKDLQEFLNATCYISVANIEKKLVSRYDKTVKYLLSFNDGERVEAVVMNYRHGKTICISTQVGCKMGCTFCATGQGGFSRDLTPSEMIAQVETAQKDLNARISNIVLMGMGEPLDNFNNVVKFLQLISSPNGHNVGMRHITLSTCGIVPEIYKLAEYKFPITLSISLHAPNDKIRNKTMPINKVYPIDTLIKACKDYVSKTNRRISFEYALIDGVNDSETNAIELVNKIRGILCHVNLIPVNPVKDTYYEQSDSKKINAFAATLNKRGIPATVRRTLGSDINASCGQLKGSY